MLASDEQLVDSYRQGSAEALDELLRRYVSRVRASVHALVLHADDADDLTQEILLRAFRALPAFHGRAKFSTWMFRIMVNTAKNFVTQRARRATSTLSEDLPEVSTAVGPDERAIVRELDRSIEQALAELPLSLRTTIMLVSLQGLSVREAAEIEGCQITTIHWRLHQARKILKQRLARQLT